MDEASVQRYFSSRPHVKVYIKEAIIPIEPKRPCNLCIAGYPGIILEKISPVTFPHNKIYSISIRTTSISCPPLSFCWRRYRLAVVSPLEEHATTCPHRKIHLGNIIVSKSGCKRGQEGGAETLCRERTYILPGLHRRLPRYPLWGLQCLILTGQLPL